MRYDSSTLTVGQKVAVLHTVGTYEGVVTKTFKNGCEVNYGGLGVLRFSASGRVHGASTWATTVLDDYETHRKEIEETKVRDRARRAWNQLQSAIYTYKHDGKLPTAEVVAKLREIIDSFPVETANAQV